MRILVTGTQGFLGRELVSVLRDIGHHEVIMSGRRVEPEVVVCDLLDDITVRSLIENCKPDCIVHCAASVPIKVEDYENDVTANSNLVITEKILRFSTCPIVYISSMTVYGNTSVKPVSENAACFPVSLYAKSKLAGEDLICNSGREGFSLRIPGLFGLPRKSGIVYNLIQAMKKDEQPVLPDSPLVWATMHVNDAAKSIASVLACAEFHGFQPINIGYRGSQSINHLVHEVSQLCEKSFEYNVPHPLFEYDLSLAEKYNAVPAVLFRDALGKFKDEL